MDIDLFSEIIKDLILDNDEVTLPGLGTFVSEVMPSTFSDKGYTINPPYRKLSFRQRESGDGRLLTEFYSKANKTDYETSERILSEYISGLRSILQNKKIVVFPGLGRLRATKENAFFFIADEDLDIYPYGVGLEPVSLKTHEETPEEVADGVAELRRLMDEPVVAPVAGEVSSTSSETEGKPAVEAVGSEAASAGSVTEESADTEPAVTVAEPETDEPETSVAEPVIPVVEPVENTVEKSLTTVAESVEATVVEATVEEPLTAVAELVENTVEEPLTAVAEPVETMVQKTDPPKMEEDRVEEHNSPMRKRKGWRTAAIVAASVAGAVLLAFGIFILLSRVAPDFIDSILYTPEELRIINY